MTEGFLLFRYVKDIHISDTIIPSVLLFFDGLGQRLRMSFARSLVKVYHGNERLSQYFQRELVSVVLNGESTKQGLILHFTHVGSENKR